MRAIHLPGGLGSQKDRKLVFNEVSLTLWCHAVVHFEVVMSPLATCF